MKFKNKNNLKIHVQHHSGDKAAACPFCGCFFANNSKLFYHMLRRNLSSEFFLYLLFFYPFFRFFRFF